MNFFQLIICNLYLFISYKSVLSDNIDTKFPIIFTFKKSNTLSKLQESFQQSFGSYFGHSVSVNQENGINYVLIGAPRLQSDLYERVERSGSVFHCFWKETDPNNEVVCTEIDVSRASSPYGPNLVTNKMLLGLSLTTNNSSFISCAHGWAFDTTTVRPPPTPVGKCYVISNRGQALNSFEPLNPRRIRGVGSRQFEKTTHTENVAKGGRPLHSHMMSGFSSTFIRSGQNLVLGAPGYLDFMGSVVNEDFITNREELMDLDRQLRPGEYPTLNSYLGYSITNGFFADRVEFIAIGAPRNDNFNGKVYIFPANERFDRIEGNMYTIEGETLVKGEYFGATLLTLDLNNDKIDDLIVGSPFYSTQQKREIGRIYVFMGNAIDKSSNRYSNYGFDQKNIIIGHQITSRFGTALSSIDVNLDGFKDAIVGAPYERSNGESSGALYIYFGSTNGLNEDNYKRIGAENIENVVLKGFGISIVSNTDLDNNGYNDILIGSYLSENAILIRTKPIAVLKTSISFDPSEIRLHEKNCNNKQNFCFNVKYCVSYAGKHIRDKQMAIIRLDVIDSKIRVKEKRVKISSNNKSNEQKTIELRANQRNCFPNDNSFLLMVNRPQDLIDIITPIEVNLSVNLINETLDKFCKSCAYAESNSTISNIDFKHGCLSNICLSHLTLNAISKYSGNIIEKNIIEGLNDNIDVNINVVNSGEASLNTILIIKMKPMLLNLTVAGESNRCKPHYNSSLYICDVNKILQKENKENLDLHFIISGITTNNIEIEFLLNSSSSLQKTSKLRQSMALEIIRRAEIKISGDSAKKFSYSDRTPKVLFSVSYNLMKSGPSTVRSVYLKIFLPVDVIELENESEQECVETNTGYKRSTFPLTNNTIDLDCNKGSEYCSEYLCELKDFKSGTDSQPLLLSLAMIPSKISNKDFNGINLKINSKLEIKDKIRFESEISSSESVDIYFARKEAVVVEQIEPWIMFSSAGIGIFVLIITVILLIKYGFFRRKKREELIKVKQRLSMKPDSSLLKELETQDLEDE